MVSRCMPLCRSFFSSFSSKTTWYLSMSSSWTTHRREGQPTGPPVPGHSLGTHWASSQLHVIMLAAAAESEWQRPVTPSVVFSCPPLPQDASASLAMRSPRAPRDPPPISEPLGERAPSPTGLSHRFPGPLHVSRF